MNAHDRQSQTETMTTTTKARACPALLYCLPLTPSIKKDMSLTLVLAEETGLKGVWVKVTQSCPNLLQPHGLYSPRNSPGQNTGVVAIPLLQGIFPTQRLNPGVPHWRRILYQLSHQGSPRILEQVAYPFYSRSSQPRNWTGVFYIAARFFTAEPPENPETSMEKRKKIKKRIWSTRRLWQICINKAFHKNWK